MIEQAPTSTTAAGRYNTLKSEREPFQRRAEESAKLTIPSLLPPEGHTASSPLPQPYQSVGARGVNNLAAKILLALFPPGSSFFRLSLDDKVLDELAKELGDKQQQTDAKTRLEGGLAKIEQSVLTRLEQVGARAPLFDTIRHLLVPGNVLLQILEDGRLRNHYLNSYVCKRDPEGNPMELVVVENFARATLPAEVRAIVEAQEKKDEKIGQSIQNVIPVYTHVRLDGGAWKQYQEVMEQRIPGTEGEFAKDKSPWIPLRFSRIEGESYGRGFVEEYIGDLGSLEALSQALVEIAGIAANVKILVDPAGVTKRDALARSRNGAILNGNSKDVTVVSLEKLADFRVAKETADGIERRLAEAFLLGSAAVRDAERVTAEEIRLIAAELEQALGGFYSVTAVELQIPLVARYLHIMASDGALPALPKGAVRPSIVTGMEALGRGGDLAKLDSLIKGLSELFGPDEVKQSINPRTYLIRRATALGIDIKGLVRSEEEVAQMNQQSAAQEMVGSLGPQMLKNAAEGQSAPSGAEPIPE